MANLWPLYSPPPGCDIQSPCGQRLAGFVRYLRIRGCMDRIRAIMGVSFTESLNWNMEVIQNIRENLFSCRFFNNQTHTHAITHRFPNVTCGLLEQPQILSISTLVYLGPHPIEHRHVSLLEALGAFWRKKKPIQANLSVFEKMDGDVIISRVILFPPPLPSEERSGWSATHRNKGNRIF